MTDSLHPILLRDGGGMMRGIAIMLAVTLTFVPAAAQLRSAHAVVLPAGSCISSPFGPRLLPNHPQAGTYHNGVDLPAPEGTPVRAVASGKLLRIEKGGPGGLEVLIQHGSYVSVYSHLASIAPALGKGVVDAGDEIGMVGHTGVSFGPHLFFALLQDGRAIDPRAFLGVPLCKGTTARQRTPAEILAGGEKLPPSRRYYLLSDFPAAHHSQAASASTDRLCTTAVAMATGVAAPHQPSCTLLSW
jgi:hypothetical protein